MMVFHYTQPNQPIDAKEPIISETIARFIMRRGFQIDLKSYENDGKRLIKGIILLLFLSNLTVKNPNLYYEPLVRTVIIL